ncbi:MAG: hypothetical protein HKN47_10705 [Pirellulaceae bacterium]|nr:hypothetical protein [Pirellulaceae bacterium]
MTDQPRLFRPPNQTLTQSVPNMSEDNYRTICSIIGLVVGLAIMFAAGWGGMIPGAIFGAGGAVTGGIIGEKLYRRKQK